MFLKKRFVFRKTIEEEPQVNSVGNGNNMQIISVLMRYISTYKPELMPVLTNIALQNPQLLRLIIGGLAKRDTESQLETGVDDSSITRKMFDHVLEHDTDDCFKKLTCNLSNKNHFNSTDFMDLELNHMDSNECNQKFSKCPFKEYKIKDIIETMSEPLRGSEGSFQ